MAEATERAAQLKGTASALAASEYKVRRLTSDLKEKSRSGWPRAKNSKRKWLSARVECEALEAAQKERDVLQKLYNELKGSTPPGPI